MRMLFITGNEGKANEAREILGEKIERVDYDYTEVQSESLAEIASRGARECYDEFDEACFVDDSGLFIEPLDGFPGPYSSYVYSTLGNDGVLRALEGYDDRSAEFRCVVAYCDGENEDGVHTFEGVVEGRIARDRRGDGGFGYDPVFEHDGETFAEMSPEEKNEVSHRRRAYDEFAEWYGSG
ncbi:MAG: XTP/dITP diphosphatase [Halobacteria archaeon]|nr:XTP/dITP diphosphatase [Halobacteria archaeon]